MRLSAPDQVPDQMPDRMAGQVTNRQQGRAGLWRALIWLAVLACIGWALWVSGALGDAQRVIVEAQRAFQAHLAAGVRALKAGTPGAVGGLAWLGFLYGVLHAAGPGHGKVVLGAWAFSGTARLARVAAITVLASLAQSLVAIVLVLVGAWGLGLDRAGLTALAEGPVTRIGSYLLVALGAFVMLRGLWGLRHLRARAEPAPDHAHTHTHTHSHDETCGCGHAHGPDPERAARARLPEALALIAGVALRPCTGAIFVMLLTVLIGAPLAGIASVLAMGLGTALITLAVALVSARLGHAALGARHERLVRLVSGAVQIALGGLIIALYL